MKENNNQNSHTTKKPAGNSKYRKPIIPSMAKKVAKEPHIRLHYTLMATIGIREAVLLEYLVEADDGKIQESDPLVFYIKDLANNLKLSKYSTLRLLIILTSKKLINFQCKCLSHNDIFGLSGDASVTINYEAYNKIILEE